MEYDHKSPCPLCQSQTIQPHFIWLKYNRNSVGLTTTPKMSSETFTKKKSRLSYSVMFKLAAVCFAEKNGNRATARYLGINEKQIRDWRSKKSNLIRCDANAKRLKGTKKDPLQYKYSFNQINGFERLFGKQRREETAIKVDDVLNIGRLELKSSERPQLLGKRPDTLAMKNRRDHWTSLWQTTKKDNGMETLNKALIDENYKSKRESDFNERISCALALLDLQNTITNM